jgi:hypothetical protein
MIREKEILNTTGVCSETYIYNVMLDRIKEYLIDHPKTAEMYGKIELANINNAVRDIEDQPKPANPSDIPDKGEDIVAYLRKNDDEEYIPEKIPTIKPPASETISEYIMPLATGAVVAIGGSFINKKNFSLESYVLSVASEYGTSLILPALNKTDSKTDSKTDYSKYKPLISGAAYGLISASLSEKFDVNQMLMNTLLQAGMSFIGETLKSSVSDVSKLKTDK